MKGTGKGVKREGAIREGALEQITSGTLLRAVYPALRPYGLFSHLWEQSD